MTFVALATLRDAGKRHPQMNTTSAGHERDAQSNSNGAYKSTFELAESTSSSPPSSSSPLSPSLPPQPPTQHAIPPLFPHRQIYSLEWHSNIISVSLPSLPVHSSRTRRTNSHVLNGQKDTFYYILCGQRLEHLINPDPSARLASS